MQKRHIFKTLIFLANSKITSKLINSSSNHLVYHIEKYNCQLQLLKYCFAMYQIGKKSNNFKGGKVQLSLKILISILFVYKELTSPHKKSGIDL